MPNHSPLEPSNFTVTTYIEDCSRSDAAGDFLRSLPTSDVVVVVLPDPFQGMEELHGDVVVWTLSLLLWVQVSKQPA